MTPKEVIPKVQQDLFTMQDLKYRDFHAKLMPTVEKESVIGVRVPVLRTYAKKFGKTEEAKQFLKILPHQYYEENNLHGLLIDQMNDQTDKLLKQLTLKTLVDSSLEYSQSGQEMYYI